MRYLPDGTQMKAADAYTIQELGIPSLVLMERAALSSVDEMEKRGFDLSRALIVCGSGNNGGDGFAIARLLREKGMRPEILFAGSESSLSGECALQKQVAERLGVSAPAVNKWESGSTCPDISLLAPLARLFHTDLNTLLCFRENLTKEDIAGYMNEAAKLAQAEGAAAALARVKEIVKEYPSNGELLYQMGTVLRGIALMQADSPEQVSELFDCSRELYEQAAACDDVRAADKARFALASMHIQDDEYEKAEELISLLPEDLALDKKSLEISMLMKQGKNAKASALL